MARSSFFVGIACLCFASAHGQSSNWGTGERGGPEERPAPPSASTNTDEEAPFVGITNLRTACGDATEVGCMEKLKKLEKLDSDPYITVMDFEIGTLDCKSLDKAEKAKKLQFQLTTSEAVEATLKHYTVSPADAFSDKIERKIWTGVINGDKDYKGIPRSISMAWGGCDPDLFTMRVITPAFDGTTKSTTTIPCMESADKNEVCIIQILRQPEEEGEEPEESFYGSSNNRMLRATPEKSVRREGGYLSDAHRRLAQEVSEGIEAAYDRDPDIRAKSEDVRLLNEYLAAPDHEKKAFHERGLRHVGAEDVQMPSGRILTASTTIDVLVLYTKASLAASNSGEGALMSADQMETSIITAYEWANQALADSGIDATLNVVHMAQIDTTEGSDMAADLSNLFQGVGESKLANELREQYGADLVQLHGNYESSCGLGYVMTKPDSRFEIFGYSIVHVNCINNFSHIHEIGHNMGANHNKENSNSAHEYAFAQRYCDGDSPYRTIMAYESGCAAAPRVNVFSNPDIEYAGKSQGTSTANNARVIQESVSTVANFRTAVANTDQASKTTYDGSSPSPSTPTGPATPVPGSQNANASPTANSATGKEEKSQEAASTAAGASAPKGYEGCFRDTWYGLGLANMPMDEFGETSHDSCKQHCDSADYAYYALEFGFGCSCGNELPEESTKVPDDACNLPCTSSTKAENCGGNWHLAVFSVSGNTKDEPVSTVAQGKDGKVRSTQVGLNSPAD
eukprot:jgi/Undpi1/5654/HiC_scaffold_2.g00928.m1